jgi:hypothetical protein
MSWLDSPKKTDASRQRKDQQDQENYSQRHLALPRICTVRTVCEQHPCQPTGERFFLALFIDLRMPTRFAAVRNHGHSRKNYSTIR